MKRAALALLLLGCAAARAEEEDWAASKGSAAEAQLHKQLKAAVRTIPGTETQYFIGGWLQLDAIAARKQQDGAEQNTFLVSSTPFGPAPRDYRLSARQSQFNWLSKTPSSIGEISTRLEANLFPIDGSTPHHLEPGVSPGRRVGDVRQDVFDLHGRRGDSDHARLQRAERRDLRAAGVAARLAAGGRALEDRGFGRGFAGGLHGVRGDPRPAHQRKAAGPRGTRALRKRQRAFPVLGPVAQPARRHNHAVRPRDRGVDGKGLSVSGSLPAFGEDSISFQLAGGEGIGRYFNDPLSATGLALSPAGGLELVRSTGATLITSASGRPTG